MLKDFQNKLLLRQPLLWNLKIVTALLIMLVVHILFFIWGYVDGEVDFSHYNSFRKRIDEIVVLINIITTILFIVIWLVYYFRHNAFKSFYPKSSFTLYKEWLCILLIMVINCGYSFSFYCGTDIRNKSYFSEEETARRLDIISMASLFSEGGYEENGVVYEEKDGESVRVERDSFQYHYNKRNYHINSLINKSIAEFSYNRGTKDSLLELRVKKWLIENRKDSVLWVMREFDKIAKSHGAVSNVTPEKWISLVYNAPEFSKYIIVGREERYPYGQESLPIRDDSYSTTDVVESIARTDIDTLSFKTKYINGREYVYPKYFVPMRQMEDAYSVLSTAWTSPQASVFVFNLALYFGFALSLLIFSFRVTSGKQWLIAAVSLGITLLLTGILNMLGLNAMRYSVIESYHYKPSLIRDNFYIILWLIITAALTIYYFVPKNSKGISGIAVNILLWLLPFTLPFIGILIGESLRNDAVYVDNKRVTPVSFMEDFILNMPEIFLPVCLFIFALFMIFFTRSIRKWRGLPEA